MTIIEEWLLAVSIMAQTPTKDEIIVKELTLEEGWELLDKQAQKYLGMSGKEFVKKWEAGEFDEDPDQPEIMHLAMLLPFVSDGRQHS